MTCFHSFYTAAAQSLRNGEWPLWNPYQFAGVPLLANYQSTVFYPPRLLHAFLDIAVASTILMLLKFWLCGMTAFIYGRGIGLGIWPSRFISVAWMLSNYNLIWSYWPLPDVSAWLPLLMLGIERLLGARLRSGFALLFISATLLLLAGHPESAFVSGLGAGMYLLCRLIIENRRGKKLWQPLALALAAWGPALLLLAALLIPFGEYLLNSHEYNQRSQGLGDTHAFAPSTLITLFVPRYYGTEADDNRWGQMVHTFQGMMYAGLPVWLGAVLLFSRQKLRDHGTRVLSLVVPAILLFTLTLDLELVKPILGLPIMSSMWQCYFIVFPMFTLPVLAAIGLDRFLSSRATYVQLIGPFVLCVAGGLVILAYLTIDDGLLRTLKVTEYVNRQVVIAALVASATVLLLALHCRLQRPAILWSALLVLIAGDLIYATRDLRASTPRAALLYETPLVRYLQDLEKPARISAVSGGILPGLMLPYGIEEHWGHDGIYPDRIVTFYGRLGDKIWERMEPACAITHYLRKVGDDDPEFPFGDPSRFRLLTTLDEIEVYENLRAFPRAYLVGSVEVIPDEDEKFDRMIDPDFDPAQTVLVDSPEILKDADNGPIEGEVRVEHRSSTRVEISATADRPVALVLADAFYPGWKATVDGVPAEVFPADHAFRGVVLPAGSHSITFYYYPNSFRIGLWISLATMICAAVIALVILNLPRPRVDGA